MKSLGLGYLSRGSQLGARLSGSNQNKFILICIAPNVGFVEPFQTENFQSLYKIAFMKNFCRRSNSLKRSNIHKSPSRNDTVIGLRWKQFVVIYAKIRVISIELSFNLFNSRHSNEKVNMNNITKLRTLNSSELR